MIETRLTVLLMLLGAPAIAAAGELDAAVSDTVETNKSGQTSQQRVDKLADNTRDMLQEYRNTLEKIESLRTYNEQLERLSENQKEKLASLDRQLDNVEDTQRKIIPFMLGMVERLGEFIELDMPFLVNERQTRLETLQDMMDRPDVSLPDKYRRIMEAYQIELEYGRTIEASTETIMPDDQESTVDLLRIGRVALLYQTLDGKRSGYWDKQSRRWQSLPEEYNASIKRGLSIARNQAPPELFRIPAPAPTRAGTDGDTTTPAASAGETP